MVQGAGGSGRISAPLTIVGDDDFLSVEKERKGGKMWWRVVRGVIRGNGAGVAGRWGRRGLADTGAARVEVGSTGDTAKARGFAHHLQSG